MWGCIKCSILNQNSDSNSLLSSLWNHFLWNLGNHITSTLTEASSFGTFICISVTRFCWIGASCWLPYIQKWIVVYIYFSLSFLFCRRQDFFAGASLRQETEAKELLYCGKGQRSWLFLRQADTVAVLKSTVKLDNKIIKQQQRVACHNVTWASCSCGSKSQITASAVPVKSGFNHLDAI